MKPNWLYDQLPNGVFTTNTLDRFVPMYPLYEVLNAFNELVVAGIVEIVSKGKEPGESEARKVKLFPEIVAQLGESNLRKTSRYVKGETQ